MKLKNLFKTKSTWTQEAFARNKNNDIVSVNSRNSVKYCLMGGLIKCYKFNDHPNILDKLFKETGTTNLVTWNDSSLRKFQDVKKLVNKLNI